MKEIIKKAKILALRDVQINLLNRKLDYQIIPDNVFEALKEVEDSYNSPFQNQAEEDLEEVAVKEARDKELRI